MTLALIVRMTYRLEIALHIEFLSFSCFICNFFYYHFGSIFFSNMLLPDNGCFYNTNCCVNGNIILHFSLYSSPLSLFTKQIFPFYSVYSSPSFLNAHYRNLNVCLKCSLSLERSNGSNTDGKTVNKLCILSECPNRLCRMDFTLQSRTWQKMRNSNEENA